MRFSWSSRVFWCMSRLYCENAIARNHLHMSWHMSLHSLLCTGWFSLPGWPQMKAEGWFWVAMGSPSQCVWLKKWKNNSLTLCQFIHTWLNNSSHRSPLTFQSRQRASEEVEERKTGREIVWDQKTEEKMGQGEEERIAALNLNLWYGFVAYTFRRLFFTFVLLICSFNGGLEVEREKKSAQVNRSLNHSTQSQESLWEKQMFSWKTHLHNFASFSHRTLLVLTMNWGEILLVAVQLEPFLISSQPQHRTKTVSHPQLSYWVFKGSFTSYICQQRALWVIRLLLETLTVDIKDK